jgi:hypothetical protein
MHFHFSLVSLSLQKEEYNENGRLWVMPSEWQWVARVEAN